MHESSMLHLTVLGSGSAGNCALVESDECRLLLDGGLSAKQITTRLAFAGLTPEALDGILITHEHGDHISGLDVFCKKFDVPIYCNPQTAEAIRYGSPECLKNFRLFTTGAEFSVKDIVVQTFPIPHDAIDPVGFVLHHGACSMGFITDLGFATKLVFERVRHVRTLVIETNHDEKMLQSDTRRPWPVKQRIMSRHGHLSNAAAAEVLAELVGHGLERAVLGHLSRDCNTRELAMDTVRGRMNEVGADTLEVFCASQTEVSARFCVG